MRQKTGENLLIYLGFNSRQLSAWLFVFPSLLSFFPHKKFNWSLSVIRPTFSKHNKNFQKCMHHSNPRTLNVMRCMNSPAIPTTLAKKTKTCQESWHRKKTVRWAQSRAQSKISFSGCALGADRWCSSAVWNDRTASYRRHDSRLSQLFSPG